MEKEFINELYRAFMSGILINCSFLNNTYEISFVKGRRIKTDLFIKINNGVIETSIIQSAPMYPVYDSMGNIIDFGV